MLFKMNNFSLRDALPSDSKNVSDLIYITSPNLFLYMFGRKARDILSYLFRRKYNLFSYKHSTITEINGDIAGMILSYGYEAIEKESKNTGRLILKYYGIFFIFNVFNLLKIAKIIADLTSNDYYISNIAVFGQYRGYGIGKRLIEYANGEAKKLNKLHIALDVERNNKNAIEFYHHLGFKNTGVKKVDFWFNREITLLRMVKDLV